MTSTACSSPSRFGMLSDAVLVPAYQGTLLVRKFIEGGLKSLSLRGPFTRFALHGGGLSSSVVCRGAACSSPSRFGMLSDAVLVPAYQGTLLVCKFIEGGLKSLSLRGPFTRFALHRGN
jgi:hypothetical protein